RARPGIELGPERSERSRRVPRGAGSEYVDASPAFSPPRFRTSVREEAAGATPDRPAGAAHRARRLRLLSQRCGTAQHSRPVPDDPANARETVTRRIRNRNATAPRRNGDGGRCPPVSHAGKELPT